MKENLKEITKGFAFQFENEIEKNTTYGKSPEEICSTFLKDLEISEAEIEGKNILVAGCGNGILLKKLSVFNPKKIVGLDIHIKKAEMTTQNCPNIFLKEMDIVQYSSDEKFDFVYCRGVLHHTLEPQKGFFTLVENLKLTGKIFIWLYEKQRLGFLRKLKPFRWKKRNLLFFSNLLSLAVFLPYNLLSLCSFQKRKTLSTIKMNIFDALTCEIQSTHSKQEVKNWFDKKKLDFKKEKEGYLGKFKNET